MQLFQYDDKLNYFIFTQWELTHPLFLLEGQRLKLTKLVSHLNLSAKCDNLQDCLDISLFGHLISENNSLQDEMAELAETSI